MQKIKLDELQLQIMQILWDKGEATVQTIKDELPENKAIQTINTILQRLHKKNIVDFRKDGRQYVYRPLVTEEETKATVVNSFINRWFEGKSSVLVNHLLQQSDFKEDELEQLQQLINKAKEQNND